jgi:hypothetical protein
MVRWFIILGLIAAAGYFGFRSGVKKATAAMTMTVRLNEIALKQADMMRPKAYVFVYSDKKHIYLASKDKAETYLQKNFRKIERVWSCNKEQIQ